MGSGVLGIMARWHPALSRRFVRAAFSERGFALGNASAYVAALEGDDGEGEEGDGLGCGVGGDGGDVARWDSVSLGYGIDEPEDLEIRDDRPCDAGGPVDACGFVEEEVAFLRGSFDGEAAGVEEGKGVVLGDGGDDERGLGVGASDVVHVGEVRSESRVGGDGDAEAVGVRGVVEGLSRSEFDFGWAFEFELE